jgi:hypothetical protein
MRRGLDALKFAVTAISRNLRRLPRGDRLTPLIQIVARIAQRQNFLACANGGRWTAAHLAAPERVAQRNSPTLLRQSSSAKGLDSFHSLHDISENKYAQERKDERRQQRLDRAERSSFDFLCARHCCEGRSRQSRREWQITARQNSRNRRRSGERITYFKANSYLLDANLKVTLVVA